MTRLAHFAIAVDLGGTQIRAAVVNRQGKIQARAEAATKATQGPQAVIQQIHDLVAQVSASSTPADIAGVGVSSPGPLDTSRGIALDIPTLAGFTNIPFRDMLQDALHFPVALENDGIAAAIGEWRFGAGQGHANVLYVTVSTGVGGGVIIGNQVLRGRQGLAGHVGHMSFHLGDEVCACGNRGCFEAYASGTAFTKRAVREAKASAETSLGKHGQPVTAAAVFAAAAAGDALAIRLVNDEADILGRGFASLLHLYSPDVLIMGGGMGQQFATLAPRLRHSLQACAMPAFRDTPILPAALGTNSGLIGAASLIFDATP